MDYMNTALKSLSTKTRAFYTRTISAVHMAISDSHIKCLGSQESNPRASFKQCKLGFQSSTKKYEYQLTYISIHDNIKLITEISLLT